MKNSINVFGAEPEEADDAYQSLKAGKIVPNKTINTICDGLRAEIGTKTFPVIQNLVDEIIPISEKDVIQITIKIFKDDIESVISQKNQTISDSDLIQINRKLNEYIIEKFRISVNNDNMILDFIGKEYKKDMIQIYYEVKLVEKIKKIIIENNLLFDLIDNQQNIIHFKNENFRKSFLLTKNNSKSILFIK